MLSHFLFSLGRNRYTPPLISSFLISSQKSNMIDFLHVLHLRFSVSFSSYSHSHSRSVPSSITSSSNHHHHQHIITIHHHHDPSSSSSNQTKPTIHSLSNFIHLFLFSFLSLFLSVFKFKFSSVLTRLLIKLICHLDFVFLIFVR